MFDKQVGEMTSLEVSKETSGHRKGEITLGISVYTGCPGEGASESFSLEEAEQVLVALQEALVAFRKAAKKDEESRNPSRPPAYI